MNIKSKTWWGSEERSPPWDHEVHSIPNIDAVSWKHWSSNRRKNKLSPLHRFDEHCLQTRGSLVQVNSNKLLRTPDTAVKFKQYKFTTKINFKRPQCHHVIGIVTTMNIWSYRRQLLDKHWLHADRNWLHQKHWVTLLVHYQGKTDPLDESIWRRLLVSTEDTHTHELIHTLIPRP